MNIKELYEAAERFLAQMPNVIASRSELYRMRDEFTDHFTHTYIKSMPIEEYVLGYDYGPDDYSFCYQLEQELDGLGRIIGSTAFKFGVYYGRTKSDNVVKYRHAEKYGRNYTEAFANIRKAISELLIAGRDQNMAAIATNPLSIMFKGKILSIYFPDRYLNIFSDNHLDYFLTALDLDSESLFINDTVYKREKLLDFKNRYDIMSSWSVDMFAYFLYNIYPIGPNRGRA